MLTKNKSKIVKPTSTTQNPKIDWEGMNERNSIKMTEKIVQELGEPEEKFQ